MSPSPQTLLPYPPDMFVQVGRQCCFELCVCVWGGGAAQCGGCQELISDTTLGADVKRKTRLSENMFFPRNVHVALFD